MSFQVVQKATEISLATLFIIKFTCLSNNFPVHARQKFPHHGTLELSVSFHLSHYYLLYVYGNVDAVEAARQRRRRRTRIINFVLIRMGKLAHRIMRCTIIACNFKILWRQNNKFHIFIASFCMQQNRKTI